MIQSVSVAFSGDDTYYLGSRLRGRILAVKVVADSTGSDDFDITLTGETTGIPILFDTTTKETATTWYHPRAYANQEPDGDVSQDAFVEIPILNERIKCVIANTGAAKLGTVTVIYDSDE